MKVNSVIDVHVSIRHVTLKISEGNNLYTPVHMDGLHNIVELLCFSKKSSIIFLPQLKESKRGEKNHKRLYMQISQHSHVHDFLSLNLMHYK